MHLFLTFEVKYFSWKEKITALELERAGFAVQRYCLIGCVTLNDYLTFLSSIFLSV